MKIVARSVAGHAVNEDRITYFKVGDLFIFALADGVGGRAGGARAAQLLIEEVETNAYKITNWKEKEQWVNFLEAIDQKLNDDSEAGETTAIIAATDGKWLTGAMVGDSSLWLLSGTNIQDVGEGLRRKPYLGYGGATPKGFSQRLNGEVLLLASDGLTKYTSSEKIAGIIAQDDLDKAGDELLEAVRYPSGAYPDDVSFIIARLPDACSNSAKAPKEQSRSILKTVRRLFQ